MKIAILPGDGIGTEIVAEAVKVLHALDLTFEMETALVGGAAYEAHGHPLPESTLQLAKAAVETHAQVEVGDVGFGDQDRGLDIDDDLWSRHGSEGRRRGERGSPSDDLVRWR